jgi:hypothetical protein
MQKLKTLQMGKGGTLCRQINKVLKEYILLQYEGMYLS